MWTVTRPDVLGRSLPGINVHNNLHRRRSAPWTVQLYQICRIFSSSSSSTRKEKEFSEKVQNVTIPQLHEVNQSNLQFDRLQLPADQILSQENIYEFGRFVAREAILDEEYWTAAWLRAESHWENRRDDRYADNYKRKYAEQEFNSLKRRCKTVLGQKCTCIVAVKKEEQNLKRTVLKSVVGTLDLSIGFLTQGQTFPGEQVKAFPFCNIGRKSNSRFSYISNLCVAKSTRRQGVASNMLRFAISSAKAKGVEQVFVHVHDHNRPAQELYQKLGFEVIEEAAVQLSGEQTYLLRKTICKIDTCEGTYSWWSSQAQLLKVSSIFRKKCGSGPGLL